MNAVQRLRDNSFLRHNAIFFFGSIAVGALNYAFYPIIGRMLNPAEFGEVQTIVSLFLQLSIFLTVLSLVIVNIVANATEVEQRNRLVLEFEKLALAISVALLGASVIFGRQFQRFLQFESWWPFVLLALTVVITVPFMLRGAVLRGTRRFGLVSGGNIVAALGKIVFAVSLVALGFGTVGAVAGLVVAQIVAAGLIAWWAYKAGLHNPVRRNLRLPDLRLLAPELRYGGVVFIASLAIILQYSLDIIVVKHFFDAHTAGLYAGIASVARIIFFLTASFAQVLISSVKMDRSSAAKNQQLLRRSLLLVCAFGLPVLFALVALPEFVMRVLMGARYVELAHLLPALGTAIFIVSILNLLAMYYLALRRYGVAVVACIGMAFTYGLLIWHHKTLDDVVNSLLLGSIVLLALFGVWMLADNVKRRREA